MRKKYGIILILAVLLIFCIGCGLAVRLFPTAYYESIKCYAEEYGLEPALVAAIIKSESNFDVYAVSSKNAMGLMQLLPSTAEWIAQKENIPFAQEQLFESAYNIRLGCAYFAYLTEETGNTETALAAYNAGLANVKKWQKRGLTKSTTIPFPETKKYVQKVLWIKKIYDILYIFKEI